MIKTKIKLPDKFTIRKIIHVDMDAFFASVEQRDDSALKGKPVAVGGNRARGVVATASYEARRYGVFSAMPSSIAFRKCPSIIFVKPRFEVYKQVSDTIRNIFLQYTDLVEPLSLDEAYLDVTTHKIGSDSATLIAKEIKEKIFNETQLTCSAGISINKFLAKTASNINKPNGVKLIKPDEVTKFVGQLKVKNFFGVGKVTAEKMRRMGILTGMHLKSKQRSFLTNNFGKVGNYYYNACRGIDNREVNPDRIRKSVSVENTFNIDLSDVDEIKKELHKLSETLGKRISTSSLAGKTMIIKVKYTDFEQVTRSKTVVDWLRTSDDFDSVWTAFLSDERILQKSIRLLGLGLSSLNTSEKNNRAVQLTLVF